VVVFEIGGDDMSNLEEVKVTKDKFFELKGKQIDRLNAICKKKSWPEQNDFVRKNICPVCGNLLRTKHEFINGVHIGCADTLK